jgi:hypothetical protein
MWSPCSNRGNKLALRKETLRVLKANASQQGAAWPCGDTCADTYPDEPDPLDLSALHGDAAQRR